MLAIKDNVLRASRLITITWKDNCNLPHSRIRVLVVASISGRIKAQGYLALLSVRYVSSQLKCMFVELNCWVMVV